MSRYRLQLSIGNNEWSDLDTYFKTKAEVQEFIGEYRVDYEWRAGDVFKRYNCEDIFRVVKVTRL